MQYKNKFHELDVLAESLKSNLERLTHIYIFGAGQMGSQIMHTWCENDMLMGFIDNDKRKQQNGYKFYKVYSLEDYLKMKNGIIVVAVGNKVMPEILQQLRDASLSEEKDFYTHTVFCNRIFPIISVYFFNKSYVNLTQISLTERCTLKCKKCAHGCFAVNNRTAKDLTLTQVRKSADSFFSKVNFVQEFVLIGGEPLLYQSLAEAIRYIGELYRGQIGIFSITTNGTILPDEQTLNICKKYNVLIRISNYSATLPWLDDSYRKLLDTLRNHDIEYTLGKAEKEWMDYGFDYEKRDASEEELTEVFDDCQTPCREVRENRFYFCVMARSVSENMGFNVGKDDYLDLDLLQGDEGKKELLEFNLGYSEKGHLDMCNYCHGGDVVNYPIPAAEQVNIL